MVGSFEVLSQNVTHTKLHIIIILIINRQNAYLCNRREQVLSGVTV
jgi:hypothetical protein